MINKIKQFIQRGIQGYSDEDLWNLDYYLASLISRSVKDFKKIQHGIPPEIYQEYEKMNLSSDVIDIFAVKDWEKQLDLLSDKFAELINIFDKIYDGMTKEEVDKKIEESFDLLKENFHNLND